MTLLKQLSAVYIVAASAYAVTIGLAQHPGWAVAARTAAHYTAEHATTTAVALNEHVVQPGWALVREESGRVYYAAVGALNAPPKREATPVHVAQKTAPRPVRIAKAAPTHPVQKLARHTLQTTVTLDIAPQKPAAPKPAAPKPVLPGNPSPGPAEFARVERRLKDNLTQELYAHFDLFLYVSKAEKGPLAQRMYVFAKDERGDLMLRNDWPVSTGREQVEYNKAGWKLPSYTPKGYYELDPRRMYRHYRSAQWGTPMPYAMFFNWVNDGNKSGLAIHAAHGEEVSLLGQRASAGCIRLSPQNARALFDLIRTQYKGAVPRFAYDRKTATMANDGMLMRDAKGAIRFTQGYKVLVVIENYGGENVVAALM